MLLEPNKKDLPRWKPTLGRVLQKIQDLETVCMQETAEGNRHFVRSMDFSGVLVVCHAELVW